jgi:hypothetical protein
MKRFKKQGAKSYLLLKPLQFFSLAKLATYMGFKETCLLLQFYELHIT